jgi:probable O-glycosylation ligase (exosortase A-associated)
VRDIALVLIVGVLLPMVFKRPEFGAYLWAWFSLMSPHRMTYGFAYSLPFAQLIALVTMAALAIKQQRQVLPRNAITVIWAMLFFWMTLTCFFAMNSRDLVLDRWIFVFKIQLMTLVSLMLVTKPEHLKILVMVVALSIGFYGIKGGVFTIVTGGGSRVWGPGGSLLEGNNELAVGLIVISPLLYWMRETLSRRWRMPCTAAILLCLAAILGSQSRGALLAAVAMLMFLGFKSKHPIQTTIGIVIVMVLAVAFMPDSWTQRMDTIGSYKADSSAMERIWTWTTLWNAAIDRPLVGAGFRADSWAVFSAYAPRGDEWSAFGSRVFVAHSIYFQMLGEHGFPGLALFLGLWFAVWRGATKIAVQAATVEAFKDWMPLLMRMVQVSIVGYLAGGAFLSLAYLDVPYYLMGFVVLSGIYLNRVQAQSVASLSAGGGSISRAGAQA